MIYNQTHINQHHIFRLKNTELNEIYMVMSIRSFIIGMIGIFVPIYLYTLTHTVQTMIEINLLIYIFEAILEYPTALFLAHFGPKHNIAISLPILVFYFWQLWTLPTYHWPIWTLALTGAVTLALFWQGYDFDFSRSKSKGKATTQVSRMYILLAVMGAIAPFIGGEIAQRFGFHVLLGIVTVLLLFAVTPLFSKGEAHLRRKFNIRKLKRQKLTQQAISYAGSSIEASVNTSFWPMFVFLIVASTEKVGIVTSSALLLTILVTYIVGKTADKRGKCGYIKAGSAITGLTYLVKAFAFNIYQVFALNIVTSISHSLFVSPFATEYYLHADEDYRNEYVFLMELASDIGRILFFGIIYLLSFYLTTKNLLMVALIFGGFCTFLIGLMPDSRCEIPHQKERKIKVTPMLRKDKVETH